MSTGTKSKTKFEKLPEDKQIKLIKLENLLEEYEDKAEYSNYHPFNDIVCREKAALVNVDNEEADIIKATRSFQRKVVELAIELLYQSNKLVDTTIEKALTQNDYKKWIKEFDEQVMSLNDKYYQDVEVEVLVAYIKGEKKALKDLEIDLSEKALPKNVRFSEGSLTQRAEAAVFVRNMSEDLSNNIKREVAMGMAKEESNAQIAKRIRGLRDKPKTVKVHPKLDRNGNIVRRGYSYQISSKKYAETIAKSETARALNNGRLEAYQTSGVVKTVEWLSTGDKRTCSICEDFDMSTYPLSDSFGKQPAHGGCRCTWIIRKLDDDYDVGAVSEKYDLDAVDVAIGSAPTGLPFSVAETAKNEAKFAQHLKNSGLDTTSGKRRVYDKMIEQLKETRITDVQGWRATDMSDLYTLHVIKNSRLLAKRMLKERLPEATLVKEITIDKKASILGQTLTEYRRATTVHTIKISELNASRELAHTNLHEIGHTYMNGKAETFKSRFRKVRLAEKKSITANASLNIDEDFADTFAASILNPKRVKRETPLHYKFMVDEVLK